MLRTLEPQKGVENKNAEADFKNPCSYKMKSVYVHPSFSSFVRNARVEGVLNCTKLLIYIQDDKPY